MAKIIMASVMSIMASKAKHNGNESYQPANVNNQRSAWISENIIINM
jgi:hypothetical protein